MNHEERKGERSTCPIASTLDIFGDKWTLLIMRDILIKGKHRYRAFQDSPETFPTNLLSNRLKRLEQWGIIKKVLYQERPKRYEYHPTEQGKALEPVLRSMEEWGEQFFSQ